MTYKDKFKKLNKLREKSTRLQQAYSQLSQEMIAYARFKAELLSLNNISKADIDRELHKIEKLMQKTNSQIEKISVEAVKVDREISVLYNNIYW